MANICKTFGLISKENLECLEVLKAVYAFLVENGAVVLVESKAANSLVGVKGYPLEYIGSAANIAIIIGGDGHMLGAARILCKYPVKLIGINNVLFSLLS